MLRLATEDDAATLAALHQAHFKRGWGEQEFLSFFEKGGVVAHLFMRDEVAEGFIFCWAIAGECELLCVAVNEDMRGQGIARRLCGQAMADAKTHNADVIHLEVAISNKPAQGLYKSLGFEVMRRRKDYYHYPDGSTEDALTMRVHCAPSRAEQEQTQN